MISAKYTVVLKSLMDDTVASEKLNKSLATYPLYKSESNNPDVLSIIPSREQLNTKLLNHYKYREIGFETPGRFFDELEIAMNEIMPYYNQILHTVEIMNELDNPFDNVDVVETYDEERTDVSTGQTSTEMTDTSTGQTSSETSSNSSSETSGTTSADIEATHKQDHLKKSSDTPQNSVLDIDNYLSSASKETANDEDKSKETGTSSTDSSTTSAGTSETETSANSNGTSETESSASSNGTVKHTLTRKGNQGVNTYAHDIIEFRTSIINIEQMIITDKRIRELFMLVY